MLGEMIKGMEKYESAFGGNCAGQEAGKIQKPRLKVNLPCTS